MSWDLFFEVSLVLLDLSLTEHTDLLDNLYRIYRFQNLYIGTFGGSISYEITLPPGVSLTTNNLKRHLHGVSNLKNFYLLFEDNFPFN